MSEKMIVLPVFVPMLGCPHKCVFCNQHVITGVKEPVDFNSIKKDIDFAINHYRRRDNTQVELAFFGGSFTCIDFNLQKEILEYANPYVTNGHIDGIRLSTRPDYIDKRIMDMLVSYGVKTVELGIQSTSDEVLKAAGRGHTKQDIKAAVEIVKQYPVKLGLQMMVGLPGDTKKTLFKTATDIVKLQPKYIRIYPTIVLRGAYLEQMFELNKYKPLTVKEAVERVKYLKVLFEYNNLNVIRTGLQAQDGLDTGEDIIAGPYHPAFGELVDNSIYLMWIDYAIKSVINKSSQKIKVIVAKNDLSKAIGQKKANIVFLNNKYTVDISIEDGEIDSDCIVVKYEDSIRVNRRDFYNSLLKDMNLLSV